MSVTLDIHGAEELAALSGPVLLVANHGSELDADLVRDSLPKERHRGLRVVESSERIEADLKRGRWVLYFPEGRVSPDGLVHGFDPQLGAIAKSSGLPVVPVGIRGSYAARPPGRSWTAAGRPRISVRFGLPVRWRNPKKPDPDDEGGHLAFTVSVSRAVEALIAEDATSWWQSLHADPAEPAGTEATWRRIWAQAQPAESGGDSRRAGIWSR